MTSPLPRMRRSTFVRGLLGLAALGSGAWPAAAADFSVAIDVAGRQRMLTQRIVKAYCQLGLKVTPETSKAQLTDAVRRFDAKLARLRRTAPNAVVQRAVAHSATLWTPIRRLAATPPSRERARRLAEGCEELLGATHDVVLILEAAAGTAQARLVNLSGRQRMLSQRMAKLYMLRAYGVDTPGAQGQLESASEEFSAALTALRAAPENDESIARELEAVALQWEWFSGAIKLQGAQSYTLVVADASESILNSMDLITGLYVGRVNR